MCADQLQLKEGPVDGTMEDVGRSVFNYCQLVHREFVMRYGAPNIRCQKAGFRCPDHDCAFVVCVGSKKGRLHINKFSQHTCEGHIRHGKNYSMGVIANAVPAVGAFVPVAARNGGNGGALIKTVKRSGGVDITPRQAYNYLHTNQTAVVEVAQMDLIGSAMDALKRQDPGGAYTVTYTNVMYENKLEDQFQFLFVAPSSTVGVWSHFRLSPLAADSAHIYKSTLRTMYVLLTAYDANKQLQVLAFGIISTEAAAAWSRFLRLCIEHFPGMRCITTDGAKGLESNEVMALLRENNITWMKCMWHHLYKSKDAPTNPNVLQLLKKCAYARTEEYFLECIREVEELDAGAALWFRQRADVVCTFSALKQGSSRFGVVTSNSSEQANHSFKDVRGQSGIVDFVVHALRHIANTQGQRRVDIFKYKVDNPNQALVPRTMEDAMKRYSISKSLDVTNPTSITQLHGGILEYRATVSERFDVYVREDYTFSCSCAFELEHHRPCAHVYAVLVRAHGVRKSPAFSNAYDVKWYSELHTVDYWEKQYAVASVRPSFNVDDLKPSLTLAPSIQSKPGRKKTKRKSGGDDGALTFATAFNFTQQPPASSSSSSSSSNPRAMEDSIELDATKRRRVPPKCSSCNGHGHYANSCRHPNTLILRQNMEKSIPRAQTKIILDLT